jgi:beta-lactamase class A
MQYTPAKQLYTKAMYQRRPRKTKSHKPYYVLAIVVVIITGIAGTLLRWPDNAQAPAPASTKPKTSSKTQQKPQLAAPPKIDLQPTVDQWAASQSGDYSIVVYDPANKAVIASHQPDKQFFTASIYKLYVAYLALIDIQNGTQNPDTPVLGGQTLKQCIHKMIHSSDSPCGEKVLNTMGLATVTKQLNTEFKLTNTSFPAFVTSAQDAATILRRLQAKQDLNEENTTFLLDAMKTQIYRTGLPKGMPEATVADKIGFNDPLEWHDTAIITLPNGREYIVSILGGGGVRSANIASFGQTIYARLSE